jgi:Ca2+-transporting ATPase
LQFTADLEKTRTMVFVLMCVDSLLFAFCVRSFKKTIFHCNIFSNYYLLGAVGISSLLLLAAVYFVPLQKILGTQNLDIKEWGIIFVVSLLELLLIEFSKKMVFKK